MFSSADTIWTLVAMILVFFMQAGFAMVETGFTRAKNASNIIMKNLLDYVLGSIGFFILGYSLMFGEDWGGIVGRPTLFMNPLDSTIPGWVHFMFQNVFAATAATIVSGAMAERTKFKSYLAYSFIISFLIYPVSGHWIWGGGWLSQIGFLDFAGSTAVHMVGGVTALVGARMVGSRIGKYVDGKVNAIPGHNLTIGALGVFILWFAWFGFNGGSTVSATGDATLSLIGLIVMNTNISAVMATVVALFFTWRRYGKPDVSMTLNGSLAGLVGVTAGANVVSPLGAAAIGILSGFALVLAVELLDTKWKIDDPVGAIAVHGVCGSLGTILVGVFATEGGLLYGGGFTLLAVQVLGVVAVAAYVALSMGLAFYLVKKWLGLRVSKQEELVGMDIAEHGLLSTYGDFVTTAAFDSFLSRNSEQFGGAVEPVLAGALGDTAPLTAPPLSISAAESARTTGSDRNPASLIHKVDILANPESLDKLKAELNAVGITGLTVTSVHGYGVQKGETGIYRGTVTSPTLLQKVRVETVISEIPVSEVVAAAHRALYTGHPGDGKIFVYPVQDVIRISTGAAGVAALQYPEEAG